MKNYFLLLFLFSIFFQSNDLKSFQYDTYFNRKNLAIGAGFLLVLPFLYYLYNVTKKGKGDTKANNKPPNDLPTFRLVGDGKVVTGINLNKIAPSSQREKNKKKSNLKNDSGAKKISHTDLKTELSTEKSLNNEPKNETVVNLETSPGVPKTSQVDAEIDKKFAEKSLPNQNIIKQTIASDTEIKDYNERQDRYILKNSIESPDTKIFIEENGENSRKCINAYDLQQYLDRNRQLCKILFKENNIDGCVIYVNRQLRVEPYTKNIHINFLAATSEASAEELLNDLVASNKQIDHIKVNDWKINDDSVAWLTKNGFEQPSYSSNFQYLEKKIQQ